MAGSTVKVIGAVAAGAVAILAIRHLSNLNQAGQELELNPSRIQYKGANALRFNFDLELKAINPTNTDLFIENMSLEVQLTTRPLARIISNTATPIPRRSDSTLVLPFSVSVLSVGAELAAILFGKGLPKQATITGTIKANGLTTPYNDQIPFTANET